MVYNVHQSKQIAVIYAIDLAHEKFEQCLTKSFHSQNSHEGHWNLTHGLIDPI